MLASGSVNDGAGCPTCSMSVAVRLLAFSLAHFQMFDGSFLGHVFMIRKPLPKLDVAAFMRRYWQRAPLLVRGAFPSFADPLDPREIFSLAASPDAASRLVQRRGRRWLLEHGPFDRARFRQLPRRDWTLLVQDTNHFSARADALLGRFDFIPHARIDDLMVSYA